MVLSAERDGSLGIRGVPFGAVQSHIGGSDVGTTTATDSVKPRNLPVTLGCFSGIVSSSGYIDKVNHTGWRQLLQHAGVNWVCLEHVGTPKVQFCFCGFANSTVA